MIKRTIFFGNPVYLSTTLTQMVLNFPNQQKAQNIPIEDIGMLVLDNQQITITHALVNQLINNNATVLWCDEKHLPNGLMLPFDQNNTFTEKLRYQLEATEPLKKQLWRQTVSQKIENQSKVLELMGIAENRLQRMSDKVQSGDPDNYEAQAAAIYWNHLLTPFQTTRGREMEMPNAFLNYGYALLRAITARNLVASGCLPAVGIFHKNKYNAFCLADDIMEPYRPIIDLYIFDYLQTLDELPEELTKEHKAHLLKIPVLDTTIEKKTGPLMVNMQRTTASLMQCFEGKARKILYPSLAVRF
jgi:CRISP-associated protein Cas1